MSTSSITENSEDTARSNGLVEGDSFQLGVLLLVGVTVAQRLIGLGRNVVFCGILEDHELGRWSIASNFLGWAAPFVVLGLPGSFGRLSEHYRQRGQLREFLGWTSALCGLLVAAAVIVHITMPTAVAKLVFNQREQAALVPMLGLVLAAVIAMNFLTEFLTSVRLIRAVSLMHLIQSITFTCVGVMLLMTTNNHELSLLTAFGLAAAFASLLGVIYVIRLWRVIPARSASKTEQQFWKRIMPLAAWIWCGNTVANLFDVSDMFVLKHISSFPPTAVDSMLGQLYASRIVPVLIVSVAGMVGSSLLPFLIRDWEVGNVVAVQQRMNSAIKASAIGFTVVAALTHLGSPILFTWLLRGKYDSGLHLMPMAFVQYTWFGLALIAGKYLICCDRPRWGLVPLLLGLASSVLLVSVLVRSWGLQGVAWATMVANGLALASLLAMSQLQEMRWDRGAWLASILPLSLCLGGVASLLITATLLVASWRSGWLVSSDEQEYLRGASQEFWRRFGMVNWRPTAETR